MGLRPGTRLGSFEVLGPLGAGGMGEVYRARDTRLDRDVAIKVLPQSFARDPSRTARFEREARLLAAINHPAIGAIYGAEEFDSLRCIIMEFVPGETLGQRIARGPMPIAEVCDLARQIAEALEAAHDRAVIHRDLKPSNIKITPEGKIKVLDFGLAKAMEVSSGDDPTALATKVDDQTRSGVVLGTIEFMSPEQARGKPVDKRTDVWAYGCILYEMLSGRPAFGGETIADVFSAILSGEPDWSALPAATPQLLRDLLASCLQKDVHQRLHDLGDARLEIERLLGSGAAPGSATPAASAPVRKGWTAPLAAAAVATVLLATIVVWVGLRSAPPRAPVALPERKQLAVLPFRDLTGDDRDRLIGDGLLETVSVRLSGLPGLQVVDSSNVVKALAHHRERLDAARDVGANLMVVPTFQRQANAVRLTYRLIDVRTGAELASEVMEGQAFDLFSLQDRFADSVAKDLNATAPLRPAMPLPWFDAGQQARYYQAIGLLQRYDRREAVEQALEILGGLAVERPNAASVQAALGRANLALFAITKDPALAERAIASADAARSLDPDLPQVDLIAGQTLLTTGRASEAATAFRRALSANAGDLDALLGLAGALQRTGDDIGAEETFKRAIDLQPASFAAYNHLGAFYFVHGRYREAAQMFGKAAQRAPDSYRAFYNLGGALTMACDGAAAIEAFRTALALQPNDANAVSNLGLTLLWTGHSAEATVTLERAAELAPNDFRVWANLGDAYQRQALADKAGAAYARALTLVREYLRLSPKDSQAHQIAAVSLAKTGHVAAAQESIAQALALDPTNPDVLENAAAVAALAGRDAEALEWLRRAVEAGFCKQILLEQPEFFRLRNEPGFRSIMATPRNAAGS